MTASDTLNEYQFGKNKGIEGLAANRFTIHVGEYGTTPDFNSTDPLRWKRPITYPHSDARNRQSRLYLVDNEAEPTTQTIIHTNKAHTTDLIARKMASAVDTGTMASNFVFKSPNAKKDSRPIPNPNSNHPQMQAYVDYEHGPDGIFIHMMRSQQHGFHHARNLVLKLSEMNPGVKFNFGKMLNKHVSAIKDELESRGHEVEGYLSK